MKGIKIEKTPREMTVLKRTRKVMVPDFQQYPEPIVLFQRAKDFAYLVFFSN